MRQPSPQFPNPGKPDEAVLDEAMAVARRIQRPGQTREQTKLIAQGIAKGIEQCKKHQSAKVRERDKARKRYLKARQTESAQGREQPEDFPDAHGESGNGGTSAPLRVGGTLFGVFALVHLLRLLAGWTLVLGPWTVPHGLSLVAALLLAGLAAWFFRCAVASNSR